MSQQKFDIAYYRKRPDFFIEERLVSPYANKPYQLTEQERTFVRNALTFGADGRLRYQNWVYGAPKKSRKTEFACLLAITVLVLYGERFGEIYVVSNSKDQAKSRCWQGCVRILESSVFFKDSFHISRDEIIFASSGSRIIAVANNPATVAGGHPVLTIYDEAWAASPDMIKNMWVTLMPVPSRKVSARLIVSHAGTANDDHLLFDLYKRGLQQPELAPDLHAGDGLLMFWTHQSMHPWQEHWFAEAKRDLPPAEFQMMIENRFIPASSSYITPALYDATERTRAPRPSDPKLPIWVGVDVAPKRDDTALFAVTLEGDIVHLVRHKIFSPKANENLDFEASIEGTLLEWNKQFAIRLVLVDPSWMIATNQRLTRAGLKVEEFKPTTENMRSAAQLLFDLFRTESIVLYHDKQLRDIVVNTIFEETTNGLRFARHQNVKIDASVALAMAALAARRSINQTVDLAWKYRAFSSDWVDPDAPAKKSSEYEREPGAVFASGDWWRGMPGPTLTIPSADDNLAAFYRNLAIGFKWGGR